MYKNLGVSDASIAFWTSLVMLPWSLKPFWGPFLELYKTKKFFVYVTQIITGVLFGLVGLSLQLGNFFSISITLLMIIAISGATHDIAADGVYLNELDTTQQARYVGWQGAFYNIAKVFSGGVLVYLAGLLEQRMQIKFAWMIIMFAYGVIMVAIGLYTIRILPSDEERKQAVSLKHGMATLKDVIITFFQKKHIAYSLLFIVFYRFAEGQAIKITPLFFKASPSEGGLGLSTSEIGLLYGTIGAIAFVAGSIVAGHFVSKKGLDRKRLLILCAFFNIPFVAYALLAVYQPHHLLIIASAVAVEYLGYGFGFIGIILFIMQNIAPGKYKMAHYAFASGIVNLGFMIPSMISGLLSDYLGYKAFFIWVLFATIPAFVVTWLVPLKAIPVEDEGSTG
ncbi:MFS transporter [Niabella aquatica]